MYTDIGFYPELHLRADGICFMMFIISMALCTVVVLLRHCGGSCGMSLVLTYCVFSTH